MAGRKPGGLVRFKCALCHAVELTRGGSDKFRCTACREAGHFLPSAQRALCFGRAVAMSRVHAAIRDGRLPSPRSLRCADCAGPAREYEHRDYNEPLRVDPICRRCNLLRGPAKPLAGTVELMLARGHIPYQTIASAKKLCKVMGQPHVADALPARLTLEDWRRIWPVLSQGVA
jgi:hypothetical protein